MQKCYYCRAGSTGSQAAKSSLYTKEVKSRIPVMGSRSIQYVSPPGHKHRLRQVSWSQCFLPATLGRWRQPDETTSSLSRKINNDRARLHRIDHRLHMRISRAEPNLPKKTLLMSFGAGFPGIKAVVMIISTSLA